MAGHLAIGGLLVCIFKQVTTKDQALRAVVIRDPGDESINVLQAQQGRCPTIREIVRRILFEIRREVEQAIAAMRRGNPIGVQKNNIPWAVPTVVRLKQSFGKSGQIISLCLELQSRLVIRLERLPLQTDS